MPSFQSHSTLLLSQKKRKMLSRSVSLPRESQVAMSLSADTLLNLEITGAS